MGCYIVLKKNRTKLRLLCSGVAAIVFSITVLSCGKPFEGFVEISRESDFLHVIRNPAGNYVLANDIDLRYTFSPIPESFTGIFEGNGKTINNMQMPAPPTVDYGTISFGGGAELDVNELIIAFEVGTMQPSNFKYREVGMFKRIGETGVVRNLKIKLKPATADKASVWGRDNDVGAVAAYNAGRISNVEVIGGRVEGEADCVGGLVGTNAGKITNSSMTGDVKGIPATLRFSLVPGTTIGDPIGEKTGGLVGCNEAGGIIIDSYATGNVEGFRNVGGLVGKNTGSSEVALIGFTSSKATRIERSFASGVVQGKWNVGGLVGLHTGYHASIIGSYSTGDVMVDEEGEQIFLLTLASGLSAYKPEPGEIDLMPRSFGGLVGLLFGAGIIDDSYATGRVEGINDNGGLVGSVIGVPESNRDRNVVIQNSYATGRVTGHMRLGGLIGVTLNFSDHDRIDASYFDVNLTGQQEGIGESLPNPITAEVKAYYTRDRKVYTEETGTDLIEESKLPDWDSKYVWRLREGYWPKLQWEYH